MKKTSFHFEGQADYLKQLKKEKELKIFSLQKSTSFTGYKIALKKLKTSYLKRLKSVYISNF